MEIEWCPLCKHDIRDHAETAHAQKGELNTCAGAKFCGCPFTQIQLLIAKVKTFLEAQS